MSDENEFFREVTLRLCSHLKVEEGLRACMEYLPQNLPADTIYLQRHEPDLGAMRVIARATATHGERMEVLIPYTLEEPYRIRRKRRRRISFISNSTSCVTKSRYFVKESTVCFLSHGHPRGPRNSLMVLMRFFNFVLLECIIYFQYIKKYW